MFSVAFIKIETLMLQNKKHSWLPISKQWITSGGDAAASDQESRRENGKANTGGEGGRERIGLANGPYKLDVYESPVAIHRDDRK